MALHGGPLASLPSTSRSSDLDAFSAAHVLERLSGSGGGNVASRSASSAPTFSLRPLFCLSIPPP